MTLSEAEKIITKYDGHIKKCDLKTDVTCGYVVVNSINMKFEFQHDEIPLVEQLINKAREEELFSKIERSVNKKKGIVTITVVLSEKGRVLDIADYE